MKKSGKLVVGISLDDVIAKYQKKMEKRNENNPLTGKQVRKGRTIIQIAIEFARYTLDKLKDHPEGLTYRGEVLRSIAGNIDGKWFRKNLRKHGVRIVKVPNSDIYNIYKINLVKKELKKRDGQIAKDSGLL